MAISIATLGRCGQLANARSSAIRSRYHFAAAPGTHQTRGMTAEQLHMISSDPGVMHGQAVIAGTGCPSA